MGKKYYYNVAIVGKMPDNEVLLKELSLTVATKIMMMGSSEIDVVCVYDLFIAY